MGWSRWNTRGHAVEFDTVGALRTRDTPCVISVVYLHEYTASWSVGRVKTWSNRSPKTGTPLGEKKEDRSESVQSRHATFPVL